MEDTKRCASVDLVGVETIKSDMRRHLVAVLPEINFFFAIAPPSGHFREKRSSQYLFAMVNLGGVGEVSEGLEHFFLTWESMGFFKGAWPLPEGAGPL